MKKVILTALAVVMMFAALPAAAGHNYNVALGKPVTLVGDAFFTGGWGAGLVVLGSTVTDGVFLPRSTQWDQGAVWWDKTDGRQGAILIDLGSNCRITDVTIQADDNDAYVVRYLDRNGVWKVLWDVPNYDAYGAGMQTRPDPTDDTARYALPHPVVASQLRITADTPQSVDLLYSVSEVQAFGNCN